MFAMLRESLVRSGESKVVLAASGGEGLRAAVAAVPDAILLDGELPDLDSIEICRQLRADPVTEAIPVILLPARDKPDAPGGAGEASAAEASAAVYIPASIDPGRLLNVVNVVLTTPLSRRATPRAPVALGVDYRYGDCQGTATTLNLSEGGMFIVVPDPPAVGTRLRVQFAVPDCEPWEATAEVMWVRHPEAQHPYPPGMGVQFVELPAEARPRIADFVARQLAALAETRPVRGWRGS
jgi:uncharacterized protein (TIGR02266 family)